ncbi:MAG: hypothetical protein VX910_03260, partial [Candidatus Latescibacterota bacterium]|nr:hypothetical protein [Candidatus Latescibacterota bacterium]
MKYALHITWRRASGSSRFRVYPIAALKFTGRQALLIMLWKHSILRPYTMSEPWNVSGATWITTSDLAR